jgi:tetratricopeptide (TPR) repeat protein
MRAARASHLRALVALALAAGAPAATRGDTTVIVRSIGGVRPEAAALLARGGGGGPLRLQAVALALGVAAETAPVAVAVEIDGPPLLANHPGGVLGIELAVYAVDGGGRVAASRSEGIAIDLSRRAEEVSDGGVRWVGSFDLAPGEWTFRVLARVRQTGAFGLRETRATVRRAGSPGLDVVAPSAGAWIEGRSPALSPVAAAGLEALGGPPAAMAVLPSAAPSKLWILSAGAPGAFSASAQGALSATLVDGLGRAAGEPALTPSGGRALGPGLEALAVEIAPPGGAPGLRDLTVAGPGGATSSPRRLIVAAAEGTGSWNLLARVAVGGGEALPAAGSVAQTTRTTGDYTVRATPPGESTSAGPPTPALPAVPAPSGRELTRFRNAYRDAWGQYARGDRDGAVDALQTYEASVLAGDKRRGMGWLEQSDRPLVEAALQKRPAALLPLALFYRDLFRAHLAAGKIGLGRRAEQRAADLLVRLAERAGDDEEREVAAAALESFAADLLSIQAPDRAADLLERATRLIPRRAASWVALAALRERNRNLAGAAAALDRALAASPGHREARLRRARIDLLGGSSRRAIELLDALLDEPVADWAGVVATQERVRLLLAEGDVEGARARLERAVERWPHEPSLALALAYVYERAGRRADARGSAERSVASGATFGRSPRKLYAEPPVAVLSAGTAAVEAAALLRLDDLAAVAGGA